MFNHVRTLLLNRKGSSTPGEDFLGEELVPADFQPVDTTGYLATVRSLLFGSDPDRAMLNYRLRQYLGLIHATDLSQYLYDLDPRVTYDTAEEDELFSNTLFVPQVYSGEETPGLFVIGEPLIPDVIGRLQYRYDIRITGVNTVDVERQIPSPLLHSYDFNGLTAGISPRFPLRGTGYEFLLNTDEADRRFSVYGFLRPQWNLGQIAALLREIGETVLVQLFGVDAAEPYATLRNVWYQHPELAYQLSAVLLALAYRMEERRGRSG